MHRSRIYRQGDPDQKGIRKKDLKPFEEVVHGRIRKNGESKVWPRLEVLWSNLVNHARSMVAASRSGKAMSRYERIAAEAVVKLADDPQAEPGQIVVTALAMFVMREMEPPHRFKSDVAFRTQLVRRVRGLGSKAAFEVEVPQAGQQKQRYRDMTPRANAIMASWLVEVFGGTGIRIARMEIAEREAERDATKDFHAALDELI